MGIDVCFFHNKLFPCHDKTCISPECTLFERGIDVEENLTVELGARGDVELVAFERGSALADDAAIAEPFVAVVEGCERGEIVAIGQHDDGRGAIGKCKCNVLMHFLCFVVVGMRYAIRRDESVDAERPVVGLVAEIAAIGKEFFVRRIAAHVKSLVNPIPDGTANDAGVGIDDVPILAEVAEGVAHGVGVFAHEEGAVGRAFGHRAETVGMGIGVVEDVGLVEVGVAIDGACLVNAKDGLTHSHHIAASTTFVAERPPDNRRMVLVALDKGAGTIDVRCHPQRVVAHDGIAEPEGVALLTRFVHDVDAIDVAQLVE